MHSTKTEILAHLKRTDGSTVDGIASSLHLAPMTVRQHLMALERDGAVCSEEVRRATGRPHYRYVLTPEGNRLLSDGHDRLLALLVEQAGVMELNGQGPVGRRADLFWAAARALLEAHGPTAGLDLEGRTALAVELLRRHGSFAEHHRLEDGTLEVRDYGCVYRETVTREGPCAWHEPILEGMIGEAGVVKADAADGCQTCCRYVVRATQPASARQMEAGTNR